MSARRSFDRIAPVYRTLEYAAFGRALQRARTAHLDRLADSRDVLLVGDGDGRGLAALLRAAPRAHVTSVDASAVMLDLARRRAERSGAAARVTFAHEDLRTWHCPAARYDAVVTLFVLDCFPDPVAESIARALAAGLREGGQWIFADFAIPSHGPARIASRVVVQALYAFFRWETGIAARELPGFDRIFTALGLETLETRTFRGGLVRAARLGRSPGAGMQEPTAAC